MWARQHQVPLEMHSRQTSGSHALLLLGSAQLQVSATEQPGVLYSNLQILTCLHAVLIDLWEG